jgi:predicted metal-dependent phosphoesterase TrpH
LVALAAQRGIRFLGLTDHDSTDGLREADKAGRELGVTVIPGVELGTEVATGELHMLGYFIDPSSLAFQEALAAFRNARQTRVEQMLRQLAAIGVTIPLAEVERLATGAIGRAHVARALIATGYAESMDDAFARYLGRGRPGYVPRARLTPVAAVELIRAAGGAPVLAHPYSVADLDRALAELTAAGLAGMEAYYAEYTPERRDALVRIAAKYGLIPSGGSDFHGLDGREGRTLGAAWVPPETVDRLRLAATGAAH